VTVLASERVIEDAPPTVAGGRWACGLHLANTTEKSVPGSGDAACRYTGSIEDAGPTVANDGPRCSTVISHDAPSRGPFVSHSSHLTSSRPTSLRLIGARCDRSREVYSGRRA